jgi:hypothetical protein
MVNEHSHIFLHNDSPYDENLFMLFMKDKIDEGFKEITVAITEPSQHVYHIDIKGYVILKQSVTKQ